MIAICNNSRRGGGGGNLHGGWGQGRDLLLHPVSNAREHRAASGQDDKK